MAQWFASLGTAIARSNAAACRAAGASPKLADVGAATAPRSFVHDARSCGTRACTPSHARGAYMRSTRTASTPGTATPTVRKLLALSGSVASAAGGAVGRVYGRNDPGTITRASSPFANSNRAMKSHPVSQYFRSSLPSILARS